MIRLTILFLTIGTALHAQELYTITGLPRTSGIPRCAVATTDGSFVIAYTAEGLGAKPDHQVIGVMKITEDGRIEWNRMIDVDDGVAAVEAPGIDAITPMAIVRTKSDELIVAANVVDVSTGQNIERGFILLTLNRSGDVIARRHIEESLTGCDT